MPRIIEIDDFSLPDLWPYRTVSEVQLMHCFEPESGIFVAESPNVIERALNAGYEPLSLLAERRRLEGPGRELIERCGEIPVYVGEARTLDTLTGFHMTLGMLCAMRRRPLPSPEEVCRGARRIAVLEGVVNPTNVGAVFRSAAALSFDALLLTGGCCDPLYRRAVRVSMGTVFQIPWTLLEGEKPVGRVADMGFATAAMALWEDCIPLDDPAPAGAERLAVFLGAEGEGLREETVRACDWRVKIPMARGVDSLNVAAASAVAFWQLGRRGEI